LKLIDTHTHLYLPEFEGDIDFLLQNQAVSGEAINYLPAINSQTHQQMIELEERYPMQCKSMMGLHPCYVKEDVEKELLIVEEWLKKRKFSAIGECGLDLYWDKTYVEQQKMALVQQMSWAKFYDLPIVLHTRNATQETIEMVKKHGHEGMSGVFHCFGGNEKEAQEIIALGFYLGVGGVVTYKNGGLDVVLKEIDLKHIVLETDAPYLAPVPFRGKRNEPAYLKNIAQKIADIKGCSLEEVAKITTENAEQLFRSKKEM
jgi:TatD DNase family protein